MLLRHRKHRIRLPRSRRARVTLFGAVAALLALPLVVPVLPGMGTPAHAEPTDRRLGSWNMNGQFLGVDGPGRDSRWATSVVPRFDNVDVLALQEAGSEPPGANTGRRFSQSTVSEHIWHAGANERNPNRIGPANIYWADVGQQRNGLAFVTRETVTDAVTVDVAGSRRPIFGIQINNDWYWTGHARSLGNQPNDQVQMYEAARDCMRGHAPGADWMFMADFNNPPGSIPVQLQRHAIVADQPTHQGGRELDYWLMGGRNNGTLSLDRPGGPDTSDHFYLNLVRNQCRRDIADCTSPLPGRTYRFESQKETGHALSIADRPQVAKFDKITAENDPSFRVTVRYSNYPGTYMLSVAGDKCLVAKPQGRDWYADTGQCSPDDPSYQWRLTADGIHSVAAKNAGAGTELQAGISIIGRGLSNPLLTDNPSPYRPVEVEEPLLDDTADDSPYKRGDDDSPGGSDDDRGDPSLGQAG